MARSARPVRAAATAGVVALLMLASACTGASASQSTTQDVVPRPSASPARSAAAPGLGPARFRSPRTRPGVAPPVRLRIPAIDVRSRLVNLGREQNGRVEVPRQWQRAGWFALGPRPGQSGPAVILGHVDSRSGPAVFARLRELRTGDRVYVDRADGSTARFRVVGRMQTSKQRFPSEVVYAPTLEPSLRLITCTGTFDATAGSYRDNLVVLAVPG